MGSDLVNLAAIDDGLPETITETARAYLKVLSQVRAPMPAIVMIRRD